jgi:dTMP kinase
VKRSLIVDTHASSCYFRTSIDGDGRKALVQITERCNLHCAHCFVSSGNWGGHMRFEDLAEKVLPRLARARVQRVTLTGGEPFVHPQIMDICRLAADRDLPLGICTNATKTIDEQITELARLGNVHINVSLDGFRPQSHGKFRGDVGSFQTTVATIRKFAKAGLLQGLLSTPNALTDVEEFADLCEFAVEVGAEYVLMNPLSFFGRGVKSQGRLAADTDKMRAIHQVTERFRDQGVDLVHIRFPNDDKPLAGCDAGKLIYVFADGLTAVCPYLVFAARTPQSHYPDTDFLVGNILDGEVTDTLDGYDLAGKLRMGANATCTACSMNAVCGKGCPAALISQGRTIGEVDSEQCPVPDRPLLHIGPRFIVIEGPNGIGKTTTAALLTQRLRERGSPVHPTTEPSATPLGRLVRSSEANLSGRALALAVAADRAAHIDTEITPALEAGCIVISDRYVQSSLVLQRLDGLSIAEIWRYNAFVPSPTISFYLQLDPATIQARLNERRRLSRLERAGSPGRELTLYDDTFEFLARHGWHQAQLNCRGLTPDEVADTMLDRLTT